MSPRQETGGAQSRRQQQHRQWRERKACLGQMVQLDGSHHDWFEGRQPKAVLMVIQWRQDGQLRTGRVAAVGAMLQVDLENQLHTRVAIANRPLQFDVL